MSRSIALLLVAGLSLSLIACGSESPLDPGGASDVGAASEIGDARLADADVGIGDTTTSADAPDVVCSYPPAANDPSCPATYLEARAMCGKPCTKDSPTCSYPGAGDFVAGCYATAGVHCFIRPDADSGLPDGGGTYACVQ